MTHPKNVKTRGAGVPGYEEPPAKKPVNLIRKGKGTAKSPRTVTTDADGSGAS